MSWLPKRAVVVPIDFSEDCQTAVQTALELVDDPSHVHVIHVLFPLDVVAPGVVWGNLDDHEREQAAQKHGQGFLAGFSATAVKFLVRTGDPGAEVAAYADSVGADLIVISSHGYHGLKRFLLGSVAERVLRHSHCPLLVLRRHDAE